MYGATVTLADHTKKYNLFSLLKAVDSRISSPSCHQYFVTVGLTPTGTVTFGSDTLNPGTQQGMNALSNGNVYTSPLGIFNSTQLDSDYIQGSVDNMVISVSVNYV